MSDFNLKGSLWQVGSDWDDPIFEELLKLRKSIALRIEIKPNDNAELLEFSDSTFCSLKLYLLRFVTTLNISLQVCINDILNIGDKQNVSESI
ncbi:hypothetical protein QTP88_018047 [Uroleucon formosanum]